MIIAALGAADLPRVDGIGHKVAHPVAVAPAPANHVRMLAPTGRGARVVGTRGLARHSHRGAVLGRVNPKPPPGGADAARAFARLQG